MNKNVRLELVNDTNTKIFKNWIAFCRRPDKTVNGVSARFAKKHPRFERDNWYNKGCWNCLCCRHCSFCFYCYYCGGLRYGFHRTYSLIFK